MFNRNPRRTALLLAPIAAITLTACGDADSDASSPATTPPIAADVVTCGGAGIDESARIRYRTETLIDAPLNTIWNLQTDVERWPTWQKPVTSIKRLDEGALRDGSQFQWTTPAPATATTPEITLTITSSVHHLQPDSCIRWSGPAVGDGLRIDNGIHVWTFTQTDDGVLVRTEENWTGTQVEADVPTSTALLGAGLEAWLKDLKAAAEAKA
ncbi:SRPBCC family protein [Nocardia sp. NPDC050406]|uniref:SRPBCC family protein n=1 Tax=Nocardia sp. NPDC050406 TaxID=3364318 RepID=UPI0037AA9D2C